MPAKPLKRVDRSIKIVTGNRPQRLGGWMVKRHGRSVHRVPCRPQGSRSPLRQFSPVIGLEADDDGVNVRGSQYHSKRLGELVGGPSGFEAVACMERDVLELGRALLFPKGYAPPTNRRGHK